MPEENTDVKKARIVGGHRFTRKQLSPWFSNPLSWRFNELPADDVNETQAVDESAAGATDQTAVSQPDTGTNDVTLKDGQSVADKTVPYDRFAEVNAAAKAAKEAAEAAQNEAAALRVQNEALAREKTAPEPTDLFTQTVQALGLQDEGYLTTEQQGQVMNAMMATMSTSQADATFIQSHSDYADVVGGYDARGNFVAAAPLQRVLTKYMNNPRMRQTVTSSPQVAYELAVADPAYQASLKQKGMTDEQRAAADAQAVIKAASRPASVSDATSGQGNVDRAAAIRGMSDVEFAAHIEELKSRAS